MLADSQIKQNNPLATQQETISIIREFTDAGGSAQPRGCAHLSVAVQWPEPREDGHSDSQQRIMYHLVNTY